MKVDSKIIESRSHRDIVERLAILIEEATHRERVILHTSICAASADDFYAAIVWKEGN